MNILLVEDDDAIRSLLGEILSSRGHRVFGCASAEEAIAAYGKNFYHLMVLDVGLAGLSGIEFCRWVRSQPEGHRHFILVATGRYSPQDLQEILSAGVDDFMAKPFRPEIINLRFTVAEQQVKRLAEQNRLEQELKHEKETIFAVVETAPVLIVVLDQNGRIQRFNRACREVTGRPVESVQGQTFLEVFLSEEERDQLQLDFNTSPALSQRYPLETVWVTEDGGQRSIAWSFSEVSSTGGNGAQIICAGVDVTERRATEERLTFLAERDPLTKCYNRSQLRRVLQKATEEASQGASTVLLYMDIDNFKTINDTFGHATGDRVLTSVVLVLRQAMGQEDNIVRFGGDEFLVVLHRMTMPEARELAEKIRSQINDYLFREGGKDFNISSSIGLFKIEENINEEEVFTLVESACYAAKSRGRNRVESFQPDNVTISRLIVDSGWWTRTKEAIRKQRLELWFQPVVEIATGKVAFHEGLIRMRDEEGQIVSPQHFLPAVERSGGMSMLDRAVFQLAVETFCKNPGITLSINISEKSVKDPAFAEHIVQTFAQNHLSPNQLIFEIPENVVINLQEVWRMVNLLKMEGFRFALDDFGAGFCSISYLKHLPVEMLKIDGSFISNLVEHEMNSALVRSINETGHILKLTTVAEYVADLTTLKLLKSMGVDYAQGYLLGRPSPELKQDGTMDLS